MVAKKSARTLDNIFWYFQSSIQPLEITDDAVIKRRKKKDFDSNRNVSFILNNVWVMHMHCSSSVKTFNPSKIVKKLTGIKVPKASISYVFMISKS